MPSKSGWIDQLTRELANAKRRMEAAGHRYGLALLLARVEPDSKAATDLMFATQAAFWSSRIRGENAEAVLEAAKTYIGDDGHISDIQNGRVVAGTAKEIEELRSIMREASSDAMQVRLAAIAVSE